MSIDDKSILRFENVTRVHPSGGGVVDASFALNKGEILTLLGPSGCGKTTTLRIAMGLEHAQRGQVFYRGVVVNDPRQRMFVPPERRDMGMVFQSYAIWPHMTVFGNVALPLKARRWSRDRIAQRVREVLSVVGLSAFEDRGGTELSGGQAQRVAVARALACSPDLLIMDEPFSNIDTSLRNQMRAELKALQRELKFSVLFVTHDQVEALALSDRIAVMNQGRIVQIGTPTEIYAAPAAPFVRDFLGRSITLPGRAVSGGVDGISASLADGSTLRIAGADRRKLREPGEVLVSIRPEDITVSPAMPADDDNVLSGNVTTLQFVGEYYEAAIAVPAGGPGYSMMLHLPRGRAWLEGQKLALRLPPEALQVWDTGA